MVYEISKEVFKQRLENKLNFVFVDLSSKSSAEKVSFEGSTSISYGQNFSQKFQEQFPSKTQNILIYSLDKGDRNPEKAANELAELGHHFVYFYCGQENDLLLDKGLN